LAAGSTFCICKSRSLSRVGRCDAANDSARHVSPCAGRQPWPETTRGLDCGGLRSVWDAVCNFRLFF
jgi:hypothetical protein